MRAILMLESGRSFIGRTDMPLPPRAGWVNFDTRIVGYQEAATDAANAGKILVLTYPLIGNYGISARFDESGKAWPCALVIKEKSAIFSNWQAEESLQNWASRQKLAIIYGMDTRALTIHLREKGQMQGVVSSSVFNPGRLSKFIRENKALRRNWIKEASVKQPRSLGKDKRFRIVVLDLGISRSILRQLESLRLNIVLVPFDTPAQRILKLKPRALIISNGPEQGAGLNAVAVEIKELSGKIPILGIASGASALALSLGAGLRRMRTGHHGINYPISQAGSFKASITAQNHSYTIDEKSLSKAKGVKITAYNLNDKTIEEFQLKRQKIWGIQYYPLSPGFNEVHPVLKKFLGAFSS